MSNEFITGIAQKLNKIFGFAIYTDEIKQGFIQPCFFIRHLKNTSKRVIGDRFLRSGLFDIIYFSQGKNTYELLSVADKLVDELEVISLGDTDIRGTEMSHEIVDSTLHFMISYKTFVLREKIPGEKMDKLEKIKGDIK